MSCQTCTLLATSSKFPKWVQSQARGVQACTHHRVWAVLGCMRLSETAPRVQGSLYNIYIGQYPVWKAIQGYAGCTHILETPTTRPAQRILVVVQVNSLTGSNSGWLALCPNLGFLPRFLARYVCNRFHSTHLQLVPHPSGKLFNREIADLVQVVPVKQTSGRCCLPGTAASFNVLAIQNLAVPGQVGICLFRMFVKYNMGVNSPVRKINDDHMVDKLIYQ